MVTDESAEICLYRSEIRQIVRVYDRYRYAYRLQICLLVIVHEYAYSIYSILIGIAISAEFPLLYSCSNAIV